MLIRLPKRLKELKVIKKNRLLKEITIIQWLKEIRYELKFKILGQVSIKLFTVLA